MELREIIDKSTISRNSLDKLVELIIHNGDLLTKISNTWRVKDVLAHISWHEREMENLFKGMSLVGSEYWLLPLEERNDKIFQDYFDIDENTVLTEYKQSFPDMMVEMKKLPSEATTNPKLFDKMPLEWQPWVVVAGNTFDHYKDHIKQLESHFDYLN